MHSSSSTKTIKIWILASGLLLLWAAAFAADRAEAAAEDKVAEIDGQPILRSELEELAIAQLRQLDQQRQQILEAGLEQLIADRLVGLEATRRGLSTAELLATEVESKVPAITDTEVDAFYTENQARIQQPKEAVAEQIRGYLRQQRAASVQREFLTRLRSEHAVKIHLEPLRVALDVAGAPARGSAQAPVTLVEFSDFECPFCSRLHPDLERLRTTYGDKLRIVFRQFPLTSIHPGAQKAAEASLCAGAQGKFWEMHDALFTGGGGFAVDELKRRAGELGLDAAKFATCLDNGETAAAVAADLAAGQAAGVGGTPALFVNGRPVALVRGAQPYDLIAAIIDDELGRRAPAP